MVLEVASLAVCAKEVVINWVRTLKKKNDVIAVRQLIAFANFEPAWVKLASPTLPDESVPDRCSQSILSLGEVNFR